MHLQSNTIGRDARAVHDAHQRSWNYDQTSTRYYLRALASTAAAVGGRDITAANLGLLTEGDALAGFTLFVATKDYAVLSDVDLEDEEPDIEATILPWRSLTRASFAAYTHTEDDQSFEQLSLDFGDLVVELQVPTDTSGTVAGLGEFVRKTLSA